MATEIIMPKAGMAMETGTIVSWLKGLGEYVSAGEPLLEIETDKTTMEVEAEADGYVIRILHDEGETVPVTRPIGYLGEKDETVETPLGSEQHPPAESVDSQEPAATRTIAATPAARSLANRVGVALEDLAATGPSGEIKVRDVEAATAQRSDESGADTDKGTAASSLARKLAEHEDLDLSALEGSGPGGRILRKDVIEGLSGLRRYDPGESGPEHRYPVGNMRRIISRRMLESHLTAPPVTLNARIDVTELFALRARLIETGERRISLNDLILKAVALAVKRHEPVRTTLDDEEVVVWDSVNIGMAVAVENGLLVPVISHADTLTLTQLSQKAADLSRRAREGKLSPDELKGGTFTVTNLGMFGIHSFTPIINPPQSAILGVNAAEPILRRNENGEIVERQMMLLSLTIDHRVIDGAQGAQFLASMRELLESPLLILI